jgi:hypothetical protein
MMHERLTEITVFEIVTNLLDGVSGNELQAVFRSWIEHVQGVIDANLSYVPE